MIFPVLPLASFIETRLPMYNLQHQAVYGQQSTEVNQAVLMAVDELQAKAPQGGGYFIGLKANPPESPIGNPITFFGKPLLNPTRSTSYCSGASYSAFIGGLDAVLASRESELTDDRAEALRMQEKDGGRREDMVKMWGWWNADGPGALYALSMYSKMGTRVNPLEAQAGDFCNIDWVNGPGHSVVFLGWDVTPEGEMAMRYWSSQKSTNGLGDRTSALSTIKGMVFTRLTNPEAVFTFDPTKKMERAKVDYDASTVVATQLKQSVGR